MVGAAKKETLSIGEHLTIADVHDRHEEWRALLNSEKDLVVDASEVSTIDTAGLQLLLVLKRSVESRDRTFVWGNTCEELKAVAALVDLDKEMELIDE
jgi:anti-anti-sigma regulatory factor